MKLSGQLRKDFEQIAFDLRDAYDELGNAQQEFNDTPTEETLSAARGAFEAFEKNYDDARDLAQTVAEAIEEFINAKSDTWKEGDKGAAHEDWKTDWEELGEADDLENPFPDDPDEPSEDGEYTVDAEEFVETFESMALEPEDS